MTNVLRCKRCTIIYMLAVINNFLYKNDGMLLIMSIASCCRSDRFLGTKVGRCNGIFVEDKSAVMQLKFVEVDLHRKLLPHFCYLPPILITKLILFTLVSLKLSHLLDSQSEF